MGNSKVLGVSLAIFFGNLGFHHSYVGNYKLSFWYAFFSFTGIPMILGILEAFLMPRRVENNETEVTPLKFLLYPAGGFLAIFLLVLISVGGFHWGKEVFLS